jgi:monofunctional glycosyltransferase
MAGRPTKPSARSRTSDASRNGRRKRRNGLAAAFVRAAKWVLLFVASFFAFVVLSLFYLRFLDPPTTALHAQRRMEAWISGSEYEKRYSPVSNREVSNHLRHAVVAAEDGRFYEHNGVDWEAIKKALEDNRRRRRARGGSTITQQLAKNLYLSSHSTVWRKALELPIAYLMDFVLPKERILELYINVIEWGPGVYGIEEAAQFHYRLPAAKLTRSQSARLSAIIPAPRRRKPQRMDQLSGIILGRMNQMGW